MIEQRLTLVEKLLVLVTEEVVVVKGIFVNVSIDGMSSE